ncbi:hypothetical protein [Deinococcus sp. RM]|uniref:hypothetical protein n=1 Tax=Deinococcus sp. RM TaxID=2316359 RepID=UPI0011C23FCC|nr:hypothetical protein [Deinococcus sp. RM]
MIAMIYACPKCRSGQVQKLSLIYTSGTVTNSTRGSLSSAMVDASGNASVLSGDISATTHSQSQLASAIAPPDTTRTQRLITKSFSQSGYFICMIAIGAFFIG